MFLYHLVLQNRIEFILAPHCYYRKIQQLIPVTKTRENSSS